ncbi:MAG: dihydropteroate synthase, partial [Candidatus Edwardsbacteria bacterium]|nr:dihydropteroate synthase [Candidatus Edwardsbacteria bacterium]
MFWQCGKYKFDTADKPLIMGILNLTPDSFSDGGRFNTTDKALVQAIKMIEQGADIIDIGGESTRPGADKVSVEEEIARVVPVIEALAKKSDIPISIDTYKSEVARRSLEAGVSIINDISGLRFDQNMAGVAAEFKAGLVLMHIKGTPEDMQKDPQYDDLLDEIKKYLKDSIKIALEAGVERSAIAIDPGIGFGKTVEHNLSLIKNLTYFKDLDCPIVIGASRKSFIGKLNNDIPADER